MVSRLVTSDKIRHKSGKGYYLDEVHPFTGTVLDIYDNGQKKLEYFYKDGLRHGLERDWYDNGDRCSERSWENGKRHGYQTGWLDANRTHKSHEIGWKNGKMHGTSIQYKPDGTILFQSNYIDGVEQTVLRKILTFFSF